MSGRRPYRPAPPHRGTESHGTDAMDDRTGQDMSSNHTAVTTATAPPCDICCAAGHDPRPAIVDGKTTFGPWAYMCEAHYAEHGVGLGLGYGQRLVTS